jgi:dihydrofolate reductase
LPGDKEKTMRKIFLFMNVSLDGYFEGPGHNISFFNDDADHFEAYSPTEGQEVDTILLGHTTYEMMKSFWPTPQALKNAPEIAEFMNEKLKVAVSHKPFEPGWKNVKVISGDVAGELKKFKEQPGKNIIMFGSNNLCISLMQAGLVDEFQILVNPVVIGEGTSLFRGLPGKASLKLKQTRPFKSGKVLLIYEPVK